jgi:hypothetical protein
VAGALAGYALLRFGRRGVSKRRTAGLTSVGRGMTGLLVTLMPASATSGGAAGRRGGGASERSELARERGKQRMAKGRGPRAEGRRCVGRGAAHCGIMI